MIRLMGYRRRASGLLTPTILGNTIGANAGAAVNTDAAGLCFLVDTDVTALPSLLGGWTSALTASNGSNVFVRVSYKPVTSGEAVDPAGGSRARLLILGNVNLASPIHDAQGAGGNGNNANVPALTLSGPRFVFGLIRRGGSGVPTWAAPLDQNVVAQNTTAVLTLATSNGLLASYAGQAVSVGVGNDWAAGAIAINGAAA